MISVSLGCERYGECMGRGGWNVRCTGMVLSVDIFMVDGVYVMSIFRRYMHIWSSSTGLNMSGKS